VESFRLEFTYDDVADKAFLIGNAGVADVIASHGYEGITFLEKLVTGALQTTTISRTGESVHSRHTILGGKIIPSQYYGKCSGRSQ